MSSGWAVCPEADVMYFGFSGPFSESRDGGSDEGTDRNVYGRVTAVGRDKNGETVNGT